MASDFSHDMRPFSTGKKKQLSKKAKDIPEGYATSMLRWSLEFSIEIR